MGRISLKTVNERTDETKMEEKEACHCNIRLSIKKRKEGDRRGMLRETFLSRLSDFVSHCVKKCQNLSDGASKCSALHTEEFLNTHFLVINVCVQGWFVIFNSTHLLCVDLTHVTVRDTQN